MKILFIKFIFSLSVFTITKAFVHAENGNNITPIPMENLNPRLTEFKRIDTNNDDQLSFSELLLGDRPYMEAQSRRFHKLDLNSDGRVTRNEFETYFRNQDRDEDESHHHRRLHADNFFKQIGVAGLYGDSSDLTHPHQLLSFNFPAQNAHFNSILQPSNQLTRPKLNENSTSQNIVKLRQ